MGCVGCEGCEGCEGRDGYLDRKRNKYDNCRRRTSQSVSVNNNN